MTLKPKAHYAPSSGFHEELKKRVDLYFDQTGLSRVDDPRMALKTCGVLLAIFGCYGLLVLGVPTPAQAVACSIGLAVSIGGLGFSVAHDGNHGAFSRVAWVNRLTGMGYDAIGASSYIWRWKHNVLHHSYPNIPELDEDINRYPLFRLTPRQKRLPGHRYQSIYAWLLYGLLVIKWQFFSDFRDVLRGRTGEHAFGPLKNSELIVFWVGKLFFVFWAFVIPSLFHPLLSVLECYLLTSITLSWIMSTVLQIAHCFEDAATAPLDPLTRVIEREWAVHQIEACADFSRSSRLISWYVGGLNFQAEHHLFPHISHTHYPAISGIVEQTCREYGVRYTAFPSLGQAIASHARWLYRLGQSDSIEQSSSAATCAAERIASS